MIDVLNKIEQEDRFGIDVFGLASFVGDDTMRGRLEGLLEEETKYHSDTFYLPMATVEHRYDVQDGDFLGVLNQIPTTSDSQRRSVVSEAPSYLPYIGNSEETVGLIGLLEDGDSFVVQLKSSGLVEEPKQYKKENYVPLLDMITQTPRFESTAFSVSRSHYQRNPAFIGRLQGKLPDDDTHKYDILKYSWDDQVDNEIGALYGGGSSTGAGGLDASFMTVMDMLIEPETSGTPEGVVILAYQGENDMMGEMMNMNVETALPTPVLSSRPTFYPTASPVLVTLAPSTPLTPEPTDAPTISPTTSPSETFTYAPTTSPTASPTTLEPSYLPTSGPSTYPSQTDVTDQLLQTPTASITAAPIVTSTLSPTLSADGQPTISEPTLSPIAAPCEDTNDQFFLRKDPDDNTKGIYRKCAMLKGMQDEAKKANICKRKNGFGGRGPAKDVCPETCGLCPSTTQTPSSPTMSGTSSPTVSPTSSPTSSPSAASPSCEDTNDQFFLRKDPNDNTKGIYRKCAMLKGMKDETKKANICKRKNGFGGRGPAKDVCPETCGECESVESSSASAVEPVAEPASDPVISCDENSDDKFYWKINKNNNKPMTPACSWLSELGEKQKANICSNEDSFDGVKPAREVCPQTCGLCGSSRRRTFLRH